ncbi:hypothetical protein [Lysobacter hankyongensis]|uniref:Chemotaxis protein n=1 Tax=Lysobacter hankyongensis TaxID=1176535 RepID=A0ABP9BC87_9GAMM
MKRLLSALVVSLVLLGGCTRDPVVADLEAFDRHAAAVIRDPVSSGIEQRLAAAKTTQERITILDEWIAVMDKNTAALATFKAKTPEVAKIADGLNQSLASSIEGARAVRAALAANNSMMMNDAAIKITQGNTQLVVQVNALKQLAAEKGYELK